MIARDRRRLTPILGAICAVLALLLIAFWLGLGRGAHWRDDALPPRLPQAQAATPPPAVPPLVQFAVVWEHPLFSADRKPVPVLASGGQAADAGDLELTGVILLPHLHVALLREKSSGRALRVREGQAAGDGGPVLVELKPRSAVIDSGGSRSELELVPGPAPAPVAGAVDNAPPSVQGDAAVAQPVQQVQPQYNGGAMQDTGGSATAARVRALKARLEERRRKTQQDNGG